MSIKDTLEAIDDVPTREELGYQQYLPTRDYLSFVRCLTSDDLKSLAAYIRKLKEAIRKLDSAMDMQEKRETEEFHIPQHTARDVWDKARQAAREALKEGEL
jgi:uncharacterized protein (DUF488 family)